MDVIALAAAGIADAVAPLGTALTEEQLAMIWRLVPEPVLDDQYDQTFDILKDYLDWALYRQLRLALFLLYITPSGEVSHVFVIESLPGPATAEGLLATVQKLRFNPIADDAPVRITLMPMSFGDGSLRLRR